MNDFEVYEMYVALKAHFNGKFDYEKYNGKLKVTVDRYNERKDHKFFKLLSQKQNPEGFMVANFLEYGQNNIWIGDLVTDPDYKDTYLEWKGRVEGILYLLKADLDGYRNLNDCLVINDYHPNLLSDMINRSVSLETGIVMDGLTNCFTHWNKRLKDDIVWQNFYDVLKAYKPFVKYDTLECRNTVKQIFAQKSEKNNG